MLATIDKWQVNRGIAGQVAITVDVTYAESKTKGHATFVGSTHGGPVVLIFDTGYQTFVDDPGRFGAFGREWVRKFYS